MAGEHHENFVTAVHHLTARYAVVLGGGSSGRKQHTPGAAAQRDIPLSGLVRARKRFFGGGDAAMPAGPLTASTIIELVESPCSPSLTRWPTS